MLGYLTLILTCQLIGETFVVWTGMPVPGPVVGMLLLFSGLVLRGGLPEDLAKVSDKLLSHLSLLFVPAGVGVMLHAGLLGKEWLAISAALVASTLLTIAVTALVMVSFNRFRGDAQGDSANGTGGAGQ